MKILLIEDDNNKIKHITDYVLSEFSSFQIEVKKSYQSGLREIFKKLYNIIILDMSLPTYDTTSTESGYKFRPFGGKEILCEMKRKNIKIPTIIFTQFESFGEGENFTTLTELNQNLYKNFSNIYNGTVYYSASEASWKVELSTLIKLLSK